MFNVTEFSPGLVRFIEERMAEKDITARDLAKQAGCDAGLISHIKHKGHVPQRDTLLSIGMVLGCPEQCLIAGGYIPSTNWQPKLDAEQTYRSYKAGFMRERLIYHEHGLELAKLELAALDG